MLNRKVHPAVALVVLLSPLVLFFATDHFSFASRALAHWQSQGGANVRSSCHQAVQTSLQRYPDVRLLNPEAFNPLYVEPNNWLYTVRATARVGDTPAEQAYTCTTNASGAHVIKLTSMNDLFQ